MNRKLVFNVLGRMLTALAALLLMPLAVSVLYREWSAGIAFAATAGISLALGAGMRLLTRRHSSVLYAKEGFIIVALVWLAASSVGALPFYFSGEIPTYVDALFETVSGFTTTGASILTDVEALSRGMLFWRSFTHWIGGMGVLVFIIAFLSNISDRSIHILRAEMPGPIVGKLVPRSKDTSKVLYIMYIALTLTQIVLMALGGMPLYDSVVHAFGTAGTGGFGIRADSISSYSPYLQWVITVFMLLFGVNFNVYYFILIKRGREAVKSTELWVYGGIVLGAGLLIAANIRTMYGGVEETLRQAFFQVSSVITTTGFATTDFNLWPSFSKAILVLLMFVGACAGSTGGGLKISRLVILLKLITREIRRMVHPRAVTTVKYEGKPLDDHTQNSVATYFAVYMILILLIFLVLSLEPFDLETNFTAAVSCFNNIGPGLSVV